MMTAVICQLPSPTPIMVFIIVMRIRECRCAIKLPKSPETTARITMDIWYVSLCMGYAREVVPAVASRPPNSTSVDTASTWETLIRVWTICLFLDGNKTQHAWCRGHINMACNQWLETWDVAMIYTGRTKIRVTAQWITADHMTLSPTKLILSWTVGVKSRVMNG